MIEKIYIYSNSTRSTGRKFDINFRPDTSDTVVHVFMNDCFAYTSNKEMFKDIQHVYCVLSYDAVNLLYNIKNMFDCCLDFERIFLATTNYYYSILNKEKLSHDGIRHGFLNPLNDMTKSLTAGIRSIIICHEQHLDAEIILVNFADTADPNYGIAKVHDHEFEKNYIKHYKNIKI